MATYDRISLNYVRATRDDNPRPIIITLDRARKNLGCILDNPKDYVSSKVYEEDVAFYSGIISKFAEGFKGAIKLDAKTECPFGKDENTPILLFFKDVLPRVGFYLHPHYFDVTGRKVVDDVRFWSAIDLNIEGEELPLWNYELLMENLGCRVITEDKKMFVITRVALKGWSLFTSTFQPVDRCHRVHPTVLISWLNNHKARLIEGGR